MKFRLLAFLFAVCCPNLQRAQEHTDEKRIGAEKRLRGALGMTGDDAHEFLLGFSTKYGVDMETLIWLRYFDDEPNSADLMAPAIAMAASLVSPSFAALWDAAHDAEREITLAHLADVARTKTWRHPSEAFKRARAQPPLLLAFSVMRGAPGSSTSWRPISGIITAGAVERRR